MKNEVMTSNRHDRIIASRKSLYFWIESLGFDIKQYKPTLWGVIVNGQETFIKVKACANGDRATYTILHVAEAIDELA